MPKVGLRALAMSRLRNHYRKHLLSLQTKLSSGNSDDGSGFFDAYPRFYSTSIIAPRNRLNKRYRAIIEPNAAIIRGKSVLDIASHDGRWSLAAHKAGARYVLGIEAREHLVQNARQNLREYQVPEEQVRFVRGDVFEELDRLEPSTFDTIFCLGFLYHTMHHMLLLNKIARLRPRHLVLDTCVDLDPDSIVVLQPERVAHESAGAVPDAGDDQWVLVGSPTKSALELMLSRAGFSEVNYYDWHRAGIKRWDDLLEYRAGQRVSLVATRLAA